LKNVGLDSQKVTKLAVKLYAHPVQCAHKLVSTRPSGDVLVRKLFATNDYQDQERGTASHPPDAN